MNKLRILVADDHAILRDGLAMLINGQPDMAVVAEAGNGREAVALAKSSEADRVLGLELGADDYIGKPFSPREVVARVKAVLRRLQPHEHGVAQHGGFVLDEQQYRATLDGHPLALTPV